MQLEPNTPVQDVPPDFIIPEEEPLPEFPRFTGTLSDIAETLCPDLPYCHKFMAGLTLVGAAISGRVYLEGSKHLDPRFYTILIDDKGAGKSGSFTEVRDHIQSLLGDLHISFSIDSGPALVMELAANPRLMLFSDELAGLFEKAKQTGSSRNSLFTELLTLYDGHETENTTKGNMNLSAAVRKNLDGETGKPSIKIKNAHYSMLGCVQNDVFKTMWQGTKGATIGLQSRCVLASSGQLSVPEPQRPTDDDKLTLIVARLKEQISRFIDSSELDADDTFSLGISSNIVMSEDVAETLRSWWTLHRADLGASPRLPALISRFLIVLAITNDSQTITPELLQQGLTFGDYQIEMAARFMPSDAMTWIQEFEKLIVTAFEKHGRNGLTSNQVRQYVNPEKHNLLGGYGPFLKAWNNLVMAGRVVKVGVNRKKSPIYILDSSRES